MAALMESFLTSSLSDNTVVLQQQQHPSAKCFDALKAFNQQLISTFEFDESSMPASVKLLFLRRLMEMIKLYCSSSPCNIINEICSTNNASIEEFLCVSLTAVRICARSSYSLSPIHDIDGICLLLNIGCRTLKVEDNGTDAVCPSHRIASEALKCLINVLHKNTNTMRSFRDCLNGPMKLLEVSVDSDVPLSLRYWAARILFELTAHDRESVTLINESGGLLRLITALNSIVCTTMLCGERAEAANEIMKIIFNLTSGYVKNSGNVISEESRVTDVLVEEEYETSFRQIYSIVSNILSHVIGAVRCRDSRESLRHATHMLLNVPISTVAELSTTVLAENILTMLDTSLYDFAPSIRNTPNYTNSLLLKEIALPPLTLLRNWAINRRDIRHKLKELVLPRSLLKKSNVMPESGDSIRGRIVKLMTSHVTDVKTAAGELLFVLCKENASKLIRFVGYGNAAGLLAAHGAIGAPSPYSTNKSAMYSSDSEDEGDDAEDINPVTGAKWDGINFEKITEGMSEEQKEVEAERLMGLFQKLQDTGVVQVMSKDGDGNMNPLLNNIK